MMLYNMQGCDLQVKVIFKDCGIIPPFFFIFRLSVRNRSTKGFRFILNFLMTSDDLALQLLDTFLKELLKFLFVKVADKKISLFNSAAIKLQVMRVLKSNFNIFVWQIRM